jgi:hypothetical protein
MFQSHPNKFLTFRIATLYFDHAFIEISKMINRVDPQDSVLKKEVVKKGLVLL